ncbi:hypothetical protein [Streptomyces sp. SID161]|uniref:hypothetical protein n=1 Tax=Streptomyces sp. SID161 TaxID=2690251 RepID=UPI0013708E8F|nr:hypothetical protein [Streptomyces sp. SID161]MYW48975.1 hypothetical protein [Streptomyces sp. SID161]
MFSAPTASAAAYCDHAGYTASGEPMERCSSLSNGVLINKQTLVDNNTAVYTTYDKTGGSTVTVRLGYVYNGTHLSDAFSISSGHTVRKHFGAPADAFCQSMTGLLSSSGSLYQTPSTHC